MATPGAAAEAEASLIFAALHECVHNNADEILNHGAVLTLTTDWLVCLSERFPPCDPGKPFTPADFAIDTDEQRKLAFLFEFMQKLRLLKVVPGRHYREKAETLDLSYFKCLTSLHLAKIDTDRIAGLEGLRARLQRLRVSRGLRALDFFKTLNVEAEPRPWAALAQLNCSGNGIRKIDDSLKLFPHAKEVDLSDNDISELTEDLQHLSSVQALNLSFNHIESLRVLLEPDVIPAFAKLQVLNVANNNIVSLFGIECLQSLALLNASNNAIASYDELRRLQHLSKLQHLWLLGNPIACERHARPRILASFPDSWKDMVLDGELREPLEDVLVEHFIGPRPARQFLPVRQPAVAQPLDDSLVQGGDGEASSDGHRGNGEASASQSASITPRRRKVREAKIFASTAAADTAASEREARRRKKRKKKKREKKASAEPETGANKVLAEQESHKQKAEEIFEVGGSKALSIYQAWIDEVASSADDGAPPAISVEPPAKFDETDVLDASDTPRGIGPSVVITSTPRKEQPTDRSITPGSLSSVEAPSSSDQALELPTAPSNTSLYHSASDDEHGTPLAVQPELTPTATPKVPIDDQGAAEGSLDSTLAREPTPTSDDPGSVFHTPLTMSRASSYSSTLGMPQKPVAQDLRSALEAVREDPQSDSEADTHHTEGVEPLPPSPGFGDLGVEPLAAALAAPIVLGSQELPPAESTSDFIVDLFDRTNQTVPRIIQIQGESKLLVIDVLTAQTHATWDLSCLIEVVQLPAPEDTTLRLLFQYGRKDKRSIRFQAESTDEAEDIRMVLHPIAASNLATYMKESANSRMRCLRCDAEFAGLSEPGFNDKAMSCPSCGSSQVVEVFNTAKPEAAESPSEPPATQDGGAAELEVAAPKPARLPSVSVEPEITANNLAPEPLAEQDSFHSPFNSDDEDPGQSGNVTSLPEPDPAELDCTRLDSNLELLLNLQHFDESIPERFLGSIEGDFLAFLDPAQQPQPSQPQQQTSRCGVLVASTVKLYFFWRQSEDRPLKLLMSLPCAELRCVKVGLGVTSCTFVFPTKGFRFWPSCPSALEALLRLLAGQPPLRSCKLQPTDHGLLAQYLALLPEGTLREPEDDPTEHTVSLSAAASVKLGANELGILVYAPVRSPQGDLTLLLTVDQLFLCKEAPGPDPLEVTCRLQQIQEITSVRSLQFDPQAPCRLAVVFWGEDAASPRGPDSSDRWSFEFSSPHSVVGLARRLNDLWKPIFSVDLAWFAKLID